MKKKNQKIEDAKFEEVKNDEEVTEENAEKKMTLKEKFAKTKTSVKGFFTKNGKKIAIAAVGIIAGAIVAEKTGLVDGLLGGVAVAADEPEEAEEDATDEDTVEDEDKSEDEA